MFFEHKTLFKMEGEVPDEEYTIPIGKARIAREGKDVSIVVYGVMVSRALTAAEELAKEGIDAEVIDRGLCPRGIRRRVLGVGQKDRPRRCRA